MRRQAFSTTFKAETPAAKGTDWLPGVTPKNGGHLCLTYDSVPDHLKYKGIEKRGDGDQLFQLE